jgi:hypothetical protein
MSNIVDYVEKEHATFEEKKLSAVDSLVLSQLSYVHYDGLVGASPVLLASLVRNEVKFKAMLRSVRAPGSNARLLHACAGSRRFGAVRLIDYVSVLEPEAEKQFSAITFMLGNGSAYIAFRGTDATLVGWKEDFNMAFKCAVPAQLEGISYANQAALRMSGLDLYLGGHSKGGNIAVYAAMESAHFERIKAVFSHDGPGFCEQIIARPRFGMVLPMLHKTLPRSSVIGMLLENHEKYYVVESSRMGLAQHDPFSWRVRNGDFIYVHSVSAGSQIVDRTLNAWIGQLSDERRELFVDALFTILESGDAQNMTQARFEPVRMIEAYRGLDAETKAALAQILRTLATIARKNALRRETPSPV